MLIGKKKGPNRLIGGYQIIHKVSGDLHPEFNSHEVVSQNITAIWLEQFNTGKKYKCIPIYVGDIKNSTYVEEF